MALNNNVEAFVVHMALLAPILIYLDREAQIVDLLTKKVIILEEYSNIANVFSEKKLWYY